MAPRPTGGRIKNPEGVRITSVRITNVSAGVRKATLTLVCRMSASEEKKGRGQLLGALLRMETLQGFGEQSRQAGD